MTQHRHVQHAALSTLAFAGHKCRLPCHDGSCDAESSVGFYGMALMSAVNRTLHHIKQGEARGRLCTTKQILVYLSLRKVEKLSQIAALLVHSAFPSSL